MQRIIMGIVLFFYANNLFSQKQEIARAIITGNDTIAQIRLDEVLVKGRIRNAGRYRRQENRRNRLEYNVRKVYPYARIAATKIDEIERKLTSAKKESERKQIIKQEYAQLMKTFKAPLMKLSVTQGRILVRLIYRETNLSSFAHIREYRGSVNAYFWQSLALLFGNNLKADYDPHGTDAEIEEIVQKILQENARQGVIGKSFSNFVPQAH